MSTGLHICTDNTLLIGDNNNKINNNSLKGEEYIYIYINSRGWRVHLGARNSAWTVRLKGVKYAHDLAASFLTMVAPLLLFNLMRIFFLTRKEMSLYWRLVINTSRKVLRDVPVTNKSCTGFGLSLCFEKKEGEVGQCHLLLTAGSPSECATFPVSINFSLARAHVWGEHLENYAE